MCDHLQSDEELLEAFYACKVGAEDGLFQRLYQRHATWLMWKIKGNLFDHHEAADVLQTVLLKVIRSKRFSTGIWKPERETSVRTWLAKILKNELIDRFRKIPIPKDLSSTPGDQEDHDDADGALEGRSRRNGITNVEEPSDNGLPYSPKPPSPQEEAISNEKKARVRKAIENSPEPFRSILHMKFWGDMSQRDIGKKLGMNDVQMNRAVQMAYQMLRDRLPAEGD